MPVDIYGFAYASLVAAGGIFGYVKSNSVPSLAAGLVFGSILGYGAIKTTNDPTDIGILLGTSTALGGLMGYRFYSTGKFMPAGLITMLSAAMMLKITMGYFTHRPIKTQD